MINRLARFFCVIALLLSVSPVTSADSMSTAPIKVDSASLAYADSSHSISVNLLMQQAWAADEENDVASNLAEANARIQDAEKEMKRVKKSKSLSRFIFRILLAVGLISIGIMLASARWKQMNESVADILAAVESQQLYFGLGVMAIAVIDFLLDLGISRPLVGDGLPQIMALLAGGISIKSLIQNHEKLSSFQQHLEKLDAHREHIGLAAISVGVVHLFGGHFPLI